MGAKLTTAVSRATKNASTLFNCRPRTVFWLHAPLAKAKSGHFARRYQAWSLGSSNSSRSCHPSKARRIAPKSLHLTRRPSIITDGWLASSTPSPFNPASDDCLGDLQATGIAGQMSCSQRALGRHRAHEIVLRFLSATAGTSDLAHQCTRAGVAHVIMLGLSHVTCKFGFGRHFCRATPAPHSQGIV